MATRAIKTQNLNEVLTMTNTHELNMITERGGKIYKTPFKGEKSVTSIEKDDQFLFFDSNADGSDGTGKILAINYEDLIKPIIDPDNYPLYTERITESNDSVIPLERGGIDENDGDWLDYDYNNPYIRASIYIPIEPNTKYKFTCPSGKILRIRIMLCDNMKRILHDKWFNGVSNYQEMIISEEFSTTLDLARYLIFDVKGSGDANTELRINTKLEPAKEKVLITKLRMPEYYSLFVSQNLENTGMQFELNRDDSRVKESMFTLRAPSTDPLNATIRLLNTGLKTSQLVDLKSYREKEEDDIRGRFEIGVKSFGMNTPVPEFAVGFSDTINGEVVRKFIIDPDAKPIRLTKDGIQFRRNNYSNNNPGTKELLTLDFDELNTKVDRMYFSLLAYNLLVDQVTPGGVELVNINAANVDYSGSQEFNTVSKAIDYLMANNNIVDLEEINKSISDLYNLSNNTNSTLSLLDQSLNTKIVELTSTVNGFSNDIDTALAQSTYANDIAEDMKEEVVELRTKTSDLGVTLEKYKSEFNDTYLALSKKDAQIDQAIEDVVNNYPVPLRYTKIFKNSQSIYAEAEYANILNEVIETTTEDTCKVTACISFKATQDGLLSIKCNFNGTEYLTEYIHSIKAGYTTLTVRFTFDSITQIESGNNLILNAKVDNGTIEIEPDRMQVDVELSESVKA